MDVVVAAVAVVGAVVVDIVVAVVGSGAVVGNMLRSDAWVVIDMGRGEGVAGEKGGARSRVLVNVSSSWGQKSLSVVSFINLRSIG